MIIISGLIILIIITTVVYLVQGNMAGSFKSFIGGDLNDLIEEACKKTKNKNKRPTTKSIAK